MVEVAKRDRRYIEETSLLPDCFDCSAGPNEHLDCS